MVTPEKNYEVAIEWDQYFAILEGSLYLARNEAVLRRTTYEPRTKIIL